jgi:hypothetical protein
MAALRIIPAVHKRGEANGWVFVKPAFVASHEGVKSRSSHPDRSDLGGALIHRYRWQFARSVGRETAKVIHDRLPFLDFPEAAVLRPGIKACLIRRARRWQQVGRVIATVIERLDLRFQRLPVLVLGHNR